MNNENHIEELPAVIRFLDRFLQEQNIKWLLALGAGILLSSSFMMVARYWDSTLFSAPLKVLVMFAYTALLNQAGWWARRQLGLPTTGIVLLAITVVLLPLLFYAVNWVYFGNGSAPLHNIAVYIGLLIAATAFTHYAARRIFTHFLHQTPPTFFISYLLLSLAAALMPFLPQTTTASVGAALALWGVFFIGSIKVSRHTFWLIESHHYPRIFGFFPIALLGALFFSLFCFRLAPLIAWEWIGLGCVMTAIPVLLTADTVTGVFQQRTGNLVRPLPWSIIAPTLLGLLLCIIGVIASLTGLQSGQSPLAITPSAALAALMFALVARRTQHQGFVWMAVLLITVSYQFLPFFFKQLAMQLVQSSAAAVQEKKLPFAFYGLTYLPLLVMMTGAAHWLHSKGKSLFVQPLRYFSSGLAVLLLALACTHSKALFPVAILMTVLFAFQTWAFRMPILIRAVISAWLLSAVGWFFFSQSFLGWAGSDTSLVVILSIAFTGLLWPGTKIDQALADFDQQQHYDCRLSSLIGAILLPIGWLLTANPEANWVLVGLSLALLFAHCLYWRHQAISLYSLILLHVASIWLVSTAQMAVDNIVILSVSMLLGQWLISYALVRYPRSLIAQAFTEANLKLCQTALVLVAIVAIPLHAGGQISYAHFQAKDLMLFMALAMWLLDAARRLSKPRLLHLGMISMLIVATHLLNNSEFAWIPALWVSIALILAVTLKWVTSLSNSQSLLFFRTHTDRFSIKLLKLVGAFSVVLFNPTMICAGVLAAIGLFTVFRKHAKVNTSHLMQRANWQLLVIVVSMTSGFKMTSLFEWFDDYQQPVLLVAALFSALSLCFWQYRAYYAHQEGTIRHCLLLRVISLFCLLLSVQDAPNGWLEVMMIFGVIITWAISELYAAYHNQSEVRVWIALALLAGMGLYCHAYISLGGQKTLVILLVIALTLSAIASQLRNIKYWAIFSDPAAKVGLVLPAVLVLMGLVKPFGSLNTLAMLASAAFYFYQSRRHHQRLLVMITGLIVNAVIFKCSWALSFTDPQFFMIPIGTSTLALTHCMRNEIDSRWHNPLYYAGALMILVSPVFAIIDQGSWLHMFSLLIAAVLMVILAIGLRVRALIYTSTAFLAADLLAMIIRSTMDNPQLLPLIGVAVGGGVLALAAWSERHREDLLQRVRIVSAQLQQWA